MWWIVGLCVVIGFFNFIFGFYIALVGQSAKEETAVKNGIVQLTFEGKTKFYTISEIKNTNTL